MIFYKLHALSNDFIFFYKNDQNNVDIKGVCDRNTGIGADGVVFFEDKSDIMEISLYNKDGSLSKNPGNAFFCAAKLLSVIDKDKIHGKIISGKLIFEYKKNNSGIKAFFKEMPKKTLKDGYFEVIIGNLHKVYIRDEISHDEMLEIAKNSKDYNIEFIKKEENSFIVKVFETGVGFTSGASSAALAIFSCIAEEYIDKEVDIVFDGGVVKAVLKNNIINLTCFPHFVFSGNIDR
ncbi:MAG: hypothetical protein M0R46_11010 [Candidatus Muirbacterium halophilum]|nr:hypothetical protein [Candidatus Muirbacterium halophilum]MCK9476444.1 hypothetical protein [Candidatus Muirbacterium halophilum]